MIKEREAMKTPFVAVLMGSDSDLKTVQNTLDTLDLMDISWEVRITSAPVSYTHLTLPTNREV